MNWFTPEEVRRSAAHHGPLARGELLADVARLVLLAAAVVSAGHLVPEGPPVITVLGLGALVTVAAVPPGLALGWWRELRHEPRHGPLPARPSPSPVPPDPRHAPAARPAVVVLVVLLDRVLQALAAGAAATALAAMAWGWATLARPVAVAVIGCSAVAVAVLRRPVAEGAGRLRLRLDAATPWSGTVLVPGASVRSGGGERSGVPVPVRPAVWWFTAGRGPACRGEGGYVVRHRRAAAVVLDRAVVVGAPALAEAVAAHELGHVRTIRYGTAAAMRSGVIVAVALGLAGSGVRAVLGGSPPRPAHLLLVAALAPPAAALAAWRRRAAEEAADRYAATLVVDGPAAAEALARWFVEQGVDLQPAGMRRWWAPYPPPSVRLDVLAGRGPAGPAQPKRPVM